MAADTIDVSTAWQLIQESVNRQNTTLVLPGTGQSALTLGARSEWHLCLPATDAAKGLFTLFLPLCRPVSALRNQHVVAQLGQSLDGRTATKCGACQLINGVDGIAHLHRIRALSDAVVVGAGTATADNPQLTVRKVEGVNPVRVVIDPRKRVPEGHHLFTDEQAPTLRLVSGTFAPGSKLLPTKGVTEVPCLPPAGQPGDPALILSVLASFGLKRVFIEGGGLTVSSFLKARLLNRLHVMVAPMIIGSGQPAFSLPEIDSIDQALRPAATMVNLGSDMLFDLNFDQPC
ncbi:RibD family protein [Marinobacter changyiensis]|uniref:RibD family protein n=1 Tax=Marinobacter changyiensis TaxID=2604091 RepID=UPI0012646809|nr:RibD family protein [Marinobacter changyiensis]